MLAHNQRGLLSTVPGLLQRNYQSASNQHILDHFNPKDQLSSGGQ
uniref:Uncharacterized protein n=1 Tax=Arundo donax TaxID=35708 RepID=A0A0A9BZM6_ARUDO